MSRSTAQSSDTATTPTGASSPPLPPLSSMLLLPTAAPALAPPAAAAAAPSQLWPRTKHFIAGCASGAALVMVRQDTGKCNHAHATQSSGKRSKRRGHAAPRLVCTLCKLALTHRALRVRGLRGC